MTVVMRLRCMQAFARMSAPLLARQASGGPLIHVASGWRKARTKAFQGWPKAPGPACRRVDFQPVRAMASAAGGAKVKYAYVCRECHEEHAQWTGKCPSCDAWHT